jgi:preprotein translocase subunit SecD
MAIVLDGVVQSALGFQVPTFTGDGLRISGSFTEREARDLALVLRYGALPIQLEQQTTQIISATLGKDSLRAGLIAGFIGVASSPSTCSSTTEPSAWSSSSASACGRRSTTR